MTRTFLLLAAAATSASCYVGPTGVGDVAFYWDFSHLRADGTTRIYDANQSPGGGSGFCPESGVDTIDLTYPGGGVIDAGIPCVFAGVQGAIVTLPTGRQDVVITGRRGVNAIYQTRITVDVIDAATVSTSATLPGIQGDLDIFLHFWNFDGTVEQWASCAAAGVAEISVNLVDYFGTSLYSQRFACGSPVQFRTGSGIELDNLDVRIRGYPDAGNTPTFDSCQGQPFDHLANDTGAFGWHAKLFNAVCP